MLLARASRSAALEGRRAGGGLRWRARVAGSLVGTLFVRSLERSERVHAAMLARGYDGEPRHPRLAPAQRQRGRRGGGTGAVRRCGAGGGAPVSVEGHEGAPALLLRDVCYAYPDGTPGLLGIDLEIAQGERVALLGPNGAGKSTLLLLLNGLLRGDGDIDVFGHRLTDDTVRSIRSHIGLLFSNPDDQLFSPTVLDDVAYGPLHQGPRRGRSAGAVSRRPRRGGHGELRGAHPASPQPGREEAHRHRHRALDAPEILVLDEPTASLAPAAAPRAHRAAARTPADAAHRHPRPGDGGRPRRAPGGALRRARRRRRTYRGDPR